MIPRLRRAVPFLLAGLLAAAPARARDDLTIGIAEFPASLHPSIDALLIKSYVLGFCSARRCPRWRTAWPA